MKVGANGAGRTENPFPLRGKVRMGVNGQSNRPYTSRPSPYPNSYSYMAKPAMDDFRRGKPSRNGSPMIRDTRQLTATQPPL